DTDQYIETVPKRGYRFLAPVTELNRTESGRRSRSFRPRLIWVTTLVVLAVGGGSIISMQLWTPADPAVERFQEPAWGLPAGPPMISISPDGRHLLQAVEGSDAIARLWVRSMSDSTPRGILGTEGFSVPPVIWSPRSDAVAFAFFGPLKRVALSGAIPQQVC